MKGISSLIRCSLSICACLAVLNSQVSAQEPQLDLPASPINYSKIDWPRHFALPEAQAMDVTPKDNPTTDAGATLGRVLFYDTRLSASGKISCASCHVQEHGFSDPRPISIGHQDRKGDRNSMGLVNLRFTATGLFWDERVAMLEEQVLVPMQSPVEMGATLDHVSEVIKNDARYKPLFEQAFGDAEVNSDKVAKALAQFVRSLVSYQSKYDEGLAKAQSATEDFANFSAAENQGKAIFREKCSICHQNSRGTRAESFETFAALNNGVNSTGLDRDGGQGDWTYDPANVGLFKAASLRNIERTAPYMHDGRFATLEEVVEHYSEGVNRHPSVSGFAFRMRFSPEEKQSLIAFLKTLTDEKFLSDPKFANPWKNDSAAAPTSFVSASAAASTLPAFSEAQRQEWIAAGKGLPASEVLPWLQSLDTNKDARLDASELAPVVKTLAKTGVSPRMNTQRFNRQTLRLGGSGPNRGGLLSFDKDKNGSVTREEAPESFQYLFAAADLSVDGAIDATELRLFQAYQRLIEIDDQGRDRARVDRFLADFGVASDHQAEGKSKIKQAQTEFNERQIKLNHDLAAQLSEAMGEAKYDAFRDLVLSRPDPRPNPVSTTDRDPVEAIRARVMDFDANQDSFLDASEIEKLAVVLTESPGGFGQVAPEYPNTKMHAQRLLAFGSDGKSVGVDEVPDRLRNLVLAGDLNADQKLTIEEAEALLRERGFQNLLTSGVYVGGGFGNVFGSAELLVDKLQLAPDVADRVKSLMLAHQSEVKQTAAEIIERGYLDLKPFYTPIARSAETASARRPD